MRLLLHITFFLFLLPLFSFAQDIPFTSIPLDSALQWLDQNHVDNPDNFHKRALNTLERVYQTDNNQLKGEAHHLLMKWHAYHVLFTIDSTFYHGEKAIEYYILTGDQQKLAATYSELGYEYIDGNDMERSEKLIFDAIKIYESLNDPIGLSMTYHRMAGIFLYQKEADLSIKYGLESVKIAEQADDYENLTLAWQVLILAYEENNELEKALNAANNCINTIDKYKVGDVFTHARAYLYRGDILSELKEYQRSLEDNQRCYALVESAIGPERPAAKTYRHGIGQAYYLQGKYKEALPHLEATIDGYIGLGQGWKPKMQDFYEEIADCYLQLGNYQKAHQYQQKAHLIFDTLMQDRVANLESEALFKYESGKKDQAIAEQETIIQQNQRIQWLGIGMISLLLLFLGTLYYYLQRNQKTARALAAKNQENELLLKEIHHRVKNNLQTISSLLNLQSASISDQNALDAVQESKNRVASMALIHQKLYQGENLAAIEMRDYFETIGKAIKDSFGAKAKNISLEVNMNKIELDVDTAIPIGLITNELLTNSLKHAFPKNEGGKISITLDQGNNDLLQLTISDNGQGSDTSTEEKKEKGFGSLLIQLLTTQLGGTLKKSNESGTSTFIQFPIQEKSAA